MPDRHIRRYCADYTEAFADLLPFGLAWPRWSESITMQVVHGLSCVWEFVDGRAADLLEIESDPRKTVELLPDWERNWGLPDPCMQTPQSIQARQIALVQRMTMQGGQSRQFLINISAQIDYNITISEFRPFMVGLDACGDNRVYGDGSDPMHNQWGQIILNPNGTPVADGELSEWPNYGLGPIENRYYFVVHVHAASLMWFRSASGQCGIDPHLRIGIANDLECLINRYKPAHTIALFDYSGVGPPSDPMAGTP
jgi:uncharacterized protein YmfQ (DUF2313 family)